MLTTVINPPNSAFKSFKSTMKVYKDKILQVERELNECEISVSFVMIVSVGTPNSWNNEYPAEAFGWINDGGTFKLLYMKGCFPEAQFVPKVGQTDRAIELCTEIRTPLSESSDELIFRLGKYIMEFETKFASFIQPPLEMN